MNSTVATLLVVLVAFSYGKAAPYHEGICVDGVEVDRTCYRLPYRAGPRISYDQASVICRFHGGVLAEIPTEEVYQAVFRYVKRSWYYEPSANQIQVWLGAEYIKKDDVVLLVGGGKSYVTWYVGYPNSNANHVKMALDVPTVPTNPRRSNGMFNAPPNHVAVPLCQYRLD